MKSKTERRTSGELDFELLLMIRIIVGRAPKKRLPVNGIVALEGLVVEELFVLKKLISFDFKGFGNLEN